MAVMHLDLNQLKNAERMPKASLTAGRKKKKKLTNSLKCSIISLSNEGEVNKMDKLILTDNFPLMSTEEIMNDFEKQYFKEHRQIYYLDAEFKN